MRNKNIEYITSHDVIEQYSLPAGMNKHALLHLVKQAAPHIGLNSATIVQYDLMVDWTEDIDWQKGNLCICWLSVEMMAKTLGKSTRQIRNNTNALVNMGLISKSVDGSKRREGLRGKDGKIIWAKGINLKPVIKKLPHLQAIVKQCQEDQEQQIILHHKISIHRAELKSLITHYHPEVTEEQLTLLNIRTHRTWPREKLEQIFDDLQALWDVVTSQITSENLPKSKPSPR